MSLSDERQKELETLQKIITPSTLQLKERDQQIEELKQSLKGNWYHYIVTRSSVNTRRDPKRA